MAAQALSLRSMRGGGKLQVLLALAVTVAIIVSAWRIIPVYIKSYQFQDEIREQAKFYQVERKPPERVKEELLLSAQELGLPVPRDQVQVSGAGPGSILIQVRYTVPVDLFLFSINIPFEYNVDSKSSL